MALETLGSVDGHGLPQNVKVRKNWTQTSKISEREFVKSNES